MKKIDSILQEAQERINNIDKDGSLIPYLVDELGIAFGEIDPVVFAAAMLQYIGTIVIESEDLRFQQMITTMIGNQNLWLVRELNPEIFDNINALVESAYQSSEGLIVKH